MIESAHHPADFDTVNNIELQHGAIALAAASVRIWQPFFCATLSD
jgi:hypothetical protein